ncbi:sigma-70 family RNA polymerase sigma factor [Pedobacter sp. BS3]|uniref:RNA polymerase sigma factor n=1 Tax=Pedobacter sp. BS3 TaxID=2567937 RepID=UPI0011EEDEFD|nr:sigma-70 family RNA polymerase sigma factor [Pedobacter sp. BS3]TZF83078.1 sigma-70 family RNA polymerase sigma factor [Pedobacter sp. BS3]
MESKAHTDLWNLFIDGDDKAYSQLYLHFADVLFAFGSRYSFDKELVKDSIHDVFVDLYRYRKNLSINVNVKSYLLTSLKRKIAYLLKKQAGSDYNENAFLITFSVEDKIIDNERQREILLKVKKELDQLPDRQKEALYLRYNTELEYEEIAGIMDISVATCRTMVYRALKQLRERMENVGGYHMLLFLLRTCCPKN